MNQPVYTFYYRLGDNIDYYGRKLYLLSPDTINNDPGSYFLDGFIKVITELLHRARHRRQQSAEQVILCPLCSGLRLILRTKRLAKCVENVRRYDIPEC